MEARIQTPTLVESHIVERVARIVSSVRGTRPDYAHLAAELEPSIPFDIFGIVLLRHDRQAVRVTICRPEGNDWVAQYRQHPLADSMLGRILHSMTSSSNPAPQSQQEEQNTSSLLADCPATYVETPTATMLVENFPHGADGPPRQSGDALAGNPHLHSILIVPLIAGGHVLGTLELGSNHLHTYDDETLQRLVNAVARVLAAAIEGAQVGGNVEIQDRQRAELKHVSSALTSTVDLSMILNRIVSGITNALNVASAVATLDQRKGGLHLEAQSGMDPVLLQRIIGQRTSLSEQCIIGSSCRTRQPCVSQDIEQDERFPLSHFFTAELAMRSILSYPLLAGSKVYGVLLLCSPEPGGFTPLKTDILSLFASQATIAIHNHMLLESARQRRQFQKIVEQLELVHRHETFPGQKDQGAQDEQALFNRLREEAVHTFGVSLSSLLHFISEHMLTPNERNLREIFTPDESADMADPLDDSMAMEIQNSNGVSFAAPAALRSDVPLAPAGKTAKEPYGEILPSSPPQEERTDFLGQTTEYALARAGLLGDIGAALMLALQSKQAQVWKGSPAPDAYYEQVKRDMADPWFIVDVSGNCTYVNHAAEIFCGMQLDLSSMSPWSDGWANEHHVLFNTFTPLASGIVEASGLTLENAMSGLLPRVREVDEALAFLREFHVVQRALPADASEKPAPVQQRNEPSPPNPLRCTVAVEPVLRKLPAHPMQVSDSARNRASGSQSMLLESAPSDRHYQFMRYALYDKQGHLFANALHIHDITEQVRDEKNKAVLLSSVSHDLRTPLTTIKAAVTGLLQPGVVWDEDTRREILEDIDAETDHLHILVNALVEMSRIEMGALVLEKEWCDITEVVHATLSQSHRILDGRPVHLHIPHQLPLIQADYAQMRRVLYNLIENAARHSPGGVEIGITIDLWPTEKILSEVYSASPQFLRVQVIDQGAGVPEEERERIFKTFYSLDAQGSGLGLAICRGIVEAHQGRIWVESGPAGGSCFVFILPITS